MIAPHPSCVVCSSPRLSIAIGAHLRVAGVDRLLVGGPGPPAHPAPRAAAPGDSALGASLGWPESIVSLVGGPGLSTSPCSPRTGPGVDHRRRRPSRVAGVDRPLVGCPGARRVTLLPSRTPGRPAPSAPIPGGRSRSPAGRRPGPLPRHPARSSRTPRSTSAAAPVGVAGVDRLLVGGPGPLDITCSASSNPRPTSAAGDHPGGRCRWPAGRRPGPPPTSPCSCQQTPQSRTSPAAPRRGGRLLGQ